MASPIVLGPVEAEEVQLLKAGQAGCAEVDHLDGNKAGGGDVVRRARRECQIQEYRLLPLVTNIISGDASILSILSAKGSSRDITISIALHFRNNHRCDGGSIAKTMS